MPQPLQSSGKVSVIGMLGFGDVHTIHGNQLQPSFVWVDHMGGTIMDTLTNPTNMKADRVIGVAHAAPVFIPFHQQIYTTDTTFPADDGVYRAQQSGIPVVRWSSEKYGTVTPKQTSYADRLYGFEFFDTVLPATASLSDAPNMDQTYVTDFWRASPSGSDVQWNEQGFTLFLQKQKLGYASDVLAQKFDVEWSVFGINSNIVTQFPAKFKLSITQGSAPILSCDGRDLRASVSFGTHPVGMIGSLPSIDITQMQFVQVMIVGGRMQVTMSGLGVPMVIHLDRLWHATIVGVPVDEDNEPIVTLAYVPKGVARRLPGGDVLTRDIMVQAWPSGQSPIISGANQNANQVIITDRWEAGTCPEIPAATMLDDYDVIKTTTLFTEAMEIGVLEPRISQVSVAVAGFSQYSFSVHPIRFASEFSYTSIQQQLGFTPQSPEDVPTFDLHMHGDIAKELASGVTYECNHITTARIVVTDERLPGTQVSQYSLAASTTEPPLTYAGVNTVRYTPGIERISIRYKGITELEPPVEGSYSLFDIGTGANNCAEWLVGVVEESSFDFGSLRVYQNLNLTFNNYIGMAAFAQNTGINGAGNIAACWRWGYQHSDGIQSQEGRGWWDDPPENEGDPPTPTYGPGWSRLYGFCDTYAYAGTTGRYTVTLQCKSMMARLDDTVFHAPPNMDGWNHFRAVYTLLSMAGIPDDRIGFKTDDPLTNMVPDDPYGLEPADPDFATGGYFLPVGVGSNPWTPIARSMTVGQLMSMIQQVTQFVLFVDELGIWQYMPFMRDSSGLPRRIFREYFPYDSNQGLTQMWDVNVTFSTADVRNEVILVGLDAYNPLTFLDPIFAAERDEMSINAPVGQQPANYVGWKKNFAMTDSRFATADFAKKTAKRIFDTMRQPAIIVTFSCWGQPDLYPMDFIGVEYQRSGLSGYPAILGVSPESDNTVPLFVTKVSTSMTRTERGLIPQTRVEARYIPLEGYQEIANGVSTVGKTDGDADNTQSDEGGSGTGTVG